MYEYKNCDQQNCCCDESATHVLALEVLYAAQTLELSVHHDSQSGTQCLTLLHTER